jgi:hypothetical protein
MGHWGYTWSSKLFCNFSQLPTARKIISEMLDWEEILCCHFFFLILKEREGSQKP